MIGAGQGIVEQDQHAIAGEALERSLIAVDQRAQRFVIVVEDAHHLLGLGRLGEGGEAAQIAKQHADLAPVAFEQARRVAAGRHHIGDLRRQKTLEAAHPLDLVDLLLDRASSVALKAASSFVCSASLKACSCARSCSALMRSIARTRATSAA